QTMRRVPRTVHDALPVPPPMRRSTSGRHAGTRPVLTRCRDTRPSVRARTRQSLLAALERTVAFQRLCAQTSRHRRRAPPPAPAGEVLLLTLPRVYCSWLSDATRTPNQLAD